MKQLLGFLLLVTLVSTAAEAQTVIRVPLDYPTIQAAINASHSGDTVRVSPGTYVENINFSGKAITVVSEAGRDFTIIDGSKAGPVVRFNSGETANSVLEGFTVRNGQGLGANQGAGISIETASPTIRRNRVTESTGCSATGIRMVSSSAIIQYNIISDNQYQGCTGSGGGVVVTQPGSAQILDNVISNNKTGSSAGGIQLQNAGTVLVRGNIITGNDGGSRGGGISLDLFSQAKIIQNVIAGNKALQGGGIYWDVPANNQAGLSITNNTIVDNDGGQQGSAIFANGFDAAVPVKNNLIIGKTGQPAVFCPTSVDNFPPIFAFNNVYAEGAAAYAGICANATGTSGNISAAPLFVNRGALNLRLASGSPGIDAGDNSVPNLPPFDLDSIPRILPTAGTVDMGAYEFTAATTSTVTPLSITFADQGAGTVSDATDVTITNTGSEILVVTDVAISGEFSQTNTCQPQNGIPAGQGCTVSVRFTPFAGGPRSGKVTISSNSGIATVDLSGNGVGALTLSTSSFNFGNQRVGIATQTTVSVSNAGSGDLGISGITSTGSNFSSTHDCPASLSSGSNCTITIVFNPSARGIRFGATTVNSEGVPYIITLSGNGLAPTISFTPANLQFAFQAVGTTSSAQSVTITNSGDLPLAINSISTTGDFSGTNDCGNSLAVNATCTVNVVFSPSGLGFRGGGLIVSDDAIGSPHGIALTGTGFGASLLTANPPSLAFGNQVVNTTSSQRIVALQNTGDTMMTIASIQVSGEFARSGNCSIIAPNSQCSVFVTFTPTSVAPKTGALTITSSALGSPHSVPLSGTGVDVVVSPNSLAFGDVQVGSTSTRQATFTNNSPNPVSISGISLTEPFSQVSNCGASLASGASCVIDVTFAPVSTAGGFLSRTLSITDDAVGSPHTALMTGRGVAGAVTLGLVSRFPSDLVGTTSPAQILSLTNSGFGLLTISSITTSGDFAQTNNCGPTLSPGTNCSISIRFSPTAAGERAGFVTIVTDASGSPHQVSLAGTGLASLPAPLLITVNPKHAAAGAPELMLTATGINFSSLSVVRWNGVDRPTTFVNNSTLIATIPGTDLTPSTNFISVFTAAPGGGQSGSLSFVVYGAATLSTKDLAYDSIGEQIYASVAATAPDRANTLTAINPMTGALGTSTSIGPDPGKLAISQDSRSIYVGFDGAPQIRRFDISSQTPGTEFALGSDAVLGPYYAEDIAVAPGSPETIAVSRRIPGVSPRHAGVAIYDNGVKRSVETALQTGSNAIEFSESASTLYGYNNETSEAGFRTMSVDASGVAVTNVQTNLVSGLDTDIRFEGGRIYSSRGRIIDPVTRTVLGTLNFSPSQNVRGFVVDAALKRAFFLILFSGSLNITAVDLNTLGSIGSIELPLPPGLPSATGSLIRWGEGGLAYKTATQVITLRVPVSWVSGGSEILLTPAAGQQGQQSLNVAVTGQSTNFIQGQTTADFGAGISVNSVTVIDPQHATINISIAPSASAGLRNITLNTGVQPKVSGAFTVDLLGGSLVGWGLFTIPHTEHPSGTFKAVAVGDTHGLAIQKDGTLIGWGSNAYGQLNVPLGTFTAIATGSTHGLAIRSDGTLAAWGDNSNGQLNVPTGIFRTIAAGAFHNLAIRPDGTLVAWGWNSQGQVMAPSGKFTAVAGGFAHSLAIRQDGTLAGWGSNSQGQINVPPGTFTAIAAGDQHSIGLRTDGTLAAWGDNTYGQINVPSGTFTAIAGGRFSSLAIRSDGTLVGWGLNANGQISVPTGRFTAISARGLHGIAIRLASKAPRDFNGDGRSDILWRNTNGAVAAWLMNGLGILQAGGFGTISSDWTIAGTGDLNGDTKSDIVWRNTDGTVAVWLMDGLVLTQGALLGTIPNSWTISGIGDLNGDGKSDIVWRSTDGTVAVWLMDGLVLTQGALLGTIPSSWAIEGIGDLNEDGKSDIVWRSTDGTVAVWLMNGPTFQGALFGTIPISWTIGGVGDLNGDGKTDIVWRNTDGTVAVWLMDGLVLAQGAILGTIPGSWTLMGTGDLNGDGKSDIVWRNSDGTVAAWLMDGATLAQAGGFGVITADWIMQSSR
jgi:hypothetical protein